MYRFASSLPNVQRIEVMPYRRFGVAKYSGLGRTCAYAGLAAVHACDLTRPVEPGARRGVTVQTDAMWRG